MSDIYYLVEWANWKPDEDDEMSNEEDDRTFRSNYYATLKAAEVAAKHKVEDSDEWLAFVEIREVKLIKKVK